MTINGDDYKFVCDLIQEISGIELGEDKQYLVESRIELLLQELKLPGVEAAIRHLRANRFDHVLVKTFVDVMTTNESLFFRDEMPFEVLHKILIPNLVKTREIPKRLRIWSAACATGQEPYSIAMTLEMHCPFLKDWNVEIIATDLSEAVLKRAQEGIYTEFEVNRGLKPETLAQFFTPNPRGWEIKPEIKSKVKFQQLNLIQPLPWSEPFDLIFCRNVLIYFNLETKKNVLDALSRCLAPDGYLFLGGSETALGITDTIERVPELATSLYRKPGQIVVQSAAI